jgi:hypothetical protein
LNDKIIFDHAYWVYGLKYNLLSVAQLVILGYQLEFQNRKTKIYDATGELIGSGDQIRGNLFYLDLSEDTCLLAQFKDIWLCNKRLYHVNFDNLVSISKMK